MGQEPVGERPPNRIMDDDEAAAVACKHLADGAGDAGISVKAYVAKLNENVFEL